MRGLRPQSRQLHDRQAHLPPAPVPISTALITPGGLL